MEIGKILEAGIQFTPPKNAPLKPLNEFFKLFSQCIGEWKFSWTRGDRNCVEKTINGFWSFSWTLDHKAIHSVCTRLYSSVKNENSKSPLNQTCNITQFVYVPATDSWDFLWFPFDDEAPCTFNIVFLPPDTVLMQDPYSSGEGSKWLFSFHNTDNQFVCDQYIPDGDGNWILHGNFSAVRTK